jgi:hypothetical protein
MRIQSDFKDYYDVGMSQGMDQTLVYLRYAKIIQPEHYPFSSWWSYDHYRPLYGPPALWTDQSMIGFCGKLYPVIELTEPGTAQSPKEIRAKRVFCYKLADIDNFVKKHYPDRWDDYTKKKYDRKAKWPSNQRRGEFVRFFEDAEKYRDCAAYKHWFEDERCPIFVGHSDFRRGKHENSIIYNACLKHYDFMRVFDPYTAFQEIAMWLGNQAEPRKPIPKIDDVTMAEIKGFDKFSFRKEKAK